VSVSSGSNVAEVSGNPIDVAVLFPEFIDVAVVSLVLIDAVVSFLRSIIVDAVVVVVSVSVCVVVFVNQAKVVPSSGPGRVDHPTRGFVCVILILVMLSVSLGKLSTVVGLVVSLSGCLRP
jgi:hypothetical protein